MRAPGGADVTAHAQSTASSPCARRTERRNDKQCLIWTYRSSQAWLFSAFHSPTTYGI